MKAAYTIFIFFNKRNFILGRRDSSLESPSFTRCLSNVMVRAGQKLRLECGVAGKPFPNLIWLHNEKPLKELPNIIVIIII